MANEREEDITHGHDRPAPGDYQPPRVERLLTPADLEREILYAGTGPPPTPIV
jgi:hypothetical protein